MHPPSLFIFSVSVPAWLCALTFGVPGIRAADWTQFRGPSGSGIAMDANPPAAISGESMSWRVELPGRGLSSPVVIGDRIFLSASSGPRQETLHILCLRAADGARVWERKFRATGRTMCHDATAVAAPTPCSDGHRLYVLYSSNDLICVDFDGHLKWLRGLTLDYPNAGNSLGMASSPVLSGGTLVAQLEAEGDAFALGIDVVTGRNRWKAGRPRIANWTTPLVWRTDTGDSVLMAGQNGVSAADPLTGQERWSLPKPGSTCTHTIRFRRWRAVWKTGSAGTTPGDRTQRWAIAHPRRSIRRCPLALRMPAETLPTEPREAPSRRRRAILC